MELIPHYNLMSLSVPLTFHVEMKIEGEGIRVENSIFQSKLSKQLLLIQVLVLANEFLQTIEDNQLWDSFMSGEIPLIVVELCSERP